MFTLISVLGSIASILGAFWAFAEAKKSKSAAETAESVRNEIIGRRELVEVSRIFTETKRILNIVSKVGPASDPRQLVGLNYQDIALEVENYSRFIYEQSGHFDRFFENRATELCKDLNPDIEALSEASAANEIKEHGKRIYYKIKDFLPATKNLADGKREQTSGSQRS